MTIWRGWDWLSISLRQGADSYVRILVDGSPERRKVEAAGWDVAEDGMEIVL